MAPLQIAIAAFPVIAEKEGFVGKGGVPTQDHPAQRPARTGNPDLPPRGCLDNINNRLADVLNYLLQDLPGQELDVATAYFSIRGYQLLRHNLPWVNRFRLLLGDKPQAAQQLGLQPSKELV